MIRAAVVAGASAFVLRNIDAFSFGSAFMRFIPKTAAIFDDQVFNT